MCFLLKTTVISRYFRALHDAWCYIKVPKLGKKWKRLYCVARPDYTFEAYDTKEAYSSAAKPRYSLRPAGYCILHAAEQWKQLWTKRTAFLLQTESPKLLRNDFIWRKIESNCNRKKLEFNKQVFIWLKKRISSLQIIKVNTSSLAQKNIFRSLKMSQKMSFKSLIMGRNSIFII